MISHMLTYNYYQLDPLNRKEKFIGLTYQSNFGTKTWNNKYFLNENLYKQKLLLYNNK